MYVMRMQISPSTSYPLFGSSVYERLADRYRLPTVRTLISSLDNEITWQTDAEVYYLENLREASSKHLFQLRFTTSEVTSNLTSLFMSVEESIVCTMTLHFPVKGDRRCSSFVLETIKQLVREVKTNDLPFVVEGYMETSDNLHYIREQKLSAFVWVEDIRRYLHVWENPKFVKETKKGLNRP